MPNGGWLDGALNVVAGAEVLRRIAEGGEPPVRNVRPSAGPTRKGPAFGRSLFGSSAAAGSIADQDELRQRTDADGISPDAIGAHDVDPWDWAVEARRQLENAAAYLGVAHRARPGAGEHDPARSRTRHLGVERHLVTFRGQVTTRARH